MQDVTQRSDDFKRYGRRLSDYLLSLEQIMKMLDAGRKVFIGVEDTRLQELFLNLYPAFNSEGAFIADENGMILAAHPDKLRFNEKKIPMTPQVKTLLEKGDPLVVCDDTGDIAELAALSVKSLLIVRLETPWGKWLAGVYNGQNDPGIYLGEDQKFFNQTGKMLSYIALVSNQISVDESEYSFASDRYFWARLRGEWDYLSRASEDYARAKIPLQRKEAAYHRDFEGTSSDILLSDHLDAELCRVMRSLSKTAIPQEPSQQEPSQQEPSQQLGKLVYLAPRKDEKGGNAQIHFRVKLHDNGSETSDLDIDQYPCTALAAARICMWQAYLNSELKVPPQLESRMPFQQEGGWGFADFSPSDRFWTLTDYLLQKVEIMAGKESKSDAEWLIDWARTLWQKAYYLAADCLVEPKDEWGKVLGQIYGRIWSQTASILKSYLESQLSEGELSIDSDWLIIWLANNVLLSQRIAEYYGLVPAKNESEDRQQRMVSPGARMRFIAYLSQLVLYALHCVRHARRREELEIIEPRDDYIRPSFADVPVGLSPSLSEAQLYILSEYAYREIGVNRELCIFERLARQLYYELPLYASGSFYRDHLYHVIDVCLLGELFLRSSQPDENRQSLARAAADCAENGSTEKLLENWYVAALCHDLGYIVEQTDGLLKPVGEINGRGLDSFLDEAKQGIEDGKSKLKKGILAALTNFAEDKVDSIKEELENVEPTDHGIVGWLHLLHWLREAHKDPPTYKHALSAILRHNLPDQEVKIREEPLTFLLMLCDHLQEWGRPRVGPDPLARGIMEALRFSEQAELETKIRVRQLKVSGLRLLSSPEKDEQSENCANCIKKDEDCKENCIRLQTQIDKDGLKFELAHLEAIEGDFEPGISWFLLTRNLQCFSNQSLPYPITITLKHTPSRIWHLLPGRPLELDLLQDFANSDRKVAYLCEWIEAARKHQKGVNYEEMNGFETFTINLDKLEFPLRRGLSDGYWKEFRRWKWRRLGRQYIMANVGGWWPE